MPVNEERVRHLLDSVGLCDGIVAEHDSIWHRCCFDEWFNHFPTVLVQRDSDYLQTFLAVFPLELGEPRNLLFASMAPGSPEVEDHNLAPILLPTGSLAVAIFQSKFRRCLSVFRSLEFWKSASSRNISVRLG